MCDFLMQQKNNIKKLFLHYEEPFIPNKDKKAFLKILFSRLEQLICLNVENLDLRFVRLPTNLKHLSVHCGFNSPLSTNECVIFYIHKALVECPLIEKICIYAVEDLLSINLVSSQTEEIRKHAPKLTSLSISPVYSEIMPFIKFFTNLKELGLHFAFEDDDNIILVSDLIPIVQFPNLELLSLRCDSDLLEKIYGAFETYELPKITHLSLKILSQNFLRERDFDHIRRLFPNLRAFYGTGQCRRNNSQIYKFITECKHLKGFYYDYCGSLTALSNFIYEILNLDKVRKFETLCFCQALNSVCFKDGKNIKHVSQEIKEKLLKYTCGKLHVQEQMSPECFCRFPCLEPEYIDKYQIIPHCYTIPGPTPESESEDEI